MFGISRRVPPPVALFCPDFFAVCALPPPDAGKGLTGNHVSIQMDELLVADLFCGAGGAARGIERACQDAGIAVTIVGIDNRPMPRYPYHFVLGEWDSLDLEGFDFVWASPPCQFYSMAMNCRPGCRENHADLIAPVRALLENSQYTIENVTKAPLLNPTILCGLTFGLRVFRHRLFECSFPVVQPEHIKHSKGATVRGEIFSVFGHFSGGHRTYTRKDGTKVRFKRGTPEQWKAAMGIDWMNRDEVAQAIPPEFSRYIFSEWLRHRNALILRRTSVTLGSSRA